MKPTREKRTTTQPGLGKVTGTNRRASLPEGTAASDVETEETPVPISAPAPSGSGRAVRTTQALEKPTTGERLAHADPRAEGEGGSPGRVERVEPRPTRHASDPRVPIDVTTIDPRRIGRDASSSPPSRPAGSKPPQTAPSKSPQSAPPRKSVGGFGAVEVATGRRPIAGGAGASGRPGTPSPPVAINNATSSSGPARSKRVSIREDNLGNRVQRVPDAVGVASRTVPKLLKSKAEIAAAPIDHRAGFLLAHVDGVTSVAGLVDICGMPEEEVEQILERLRRLGIVAVR